MFPGCVNGSGMTGNTSKLVFGPLALSVMVILTTPHTGPQWIGGEKKPGLATFWYSKKRFYIGGEYFEVTTLQHSAVTS